MSEEETSSSSSSSTAGEHTKYALSPSSSLSESTERKDAINGEGNKPMASGKEERKSNPSTDANANGDIEGNKNGNNNKNVNHTSKKKRKRKQRSKSEDEQEILDLQRERYDRLMHTARKQLHKTAKQIKTFLLQKEIRKRVKNNNNKEVAENPPAPTGLSAKKTLDLEVVTSQALRQLGLYHCDPRFKMVTEETTTMEDVPTEFEESKADETNRGNEESANKINNNKRKKGAKKNSKNDDNTPPMIPALLATDDPQKALVDAVLAHKRFSKSLEEWNEKITEYRRWCMKLERRNNPNPFSVDDDFLPSKRSKKNKNKKKQGGAATGMTDVGLQATVENESSLFCTLGGGIPNDSDGIDDSFSKYSKYGPGSDLAEAPKRKNRKGQRQRRAKALAIEAKKQGRSHEYQQSANWREPKPKEYNEDSGHRTSRGRGKETSRNQRFEQKQQIQHQDHSSFHESKQQQQHQSSEGDGQQHPSWAAKQAQSTGIVAFKGTKITF